MSSSPVSPNLTKGAIIGLDAFNLVVSKVVFQYNSDMLTRTLKPQAVSAQPNQGEALRLKAPPEENIKLDLELDATDQMELGQGKTGIYPALSSLEILLYSKSRDVIANEVLSLLGIIEIIPPEAPLTFFVWGLARILPVRITDLSITEEAFDENLIPIRAKVGLGLRVLNYNDLGLTHRGGAIFMAHQIAKEILAASGDSGSLVSGVFSALGV